MQEVLNFLSELKVNNNKDWFDQNRNRYEESRKKILFLTDLIIHEINSFDPEIGNQNPKDCVFRIFRDRGPGTTWECPGFGPAIRCLASWGVEVWYVAGGKTVNCYFSPISCFATPNGVFKKT